MKCPFCGSHQTQVVESRTVSDVNAVRRRRKCDKCDKRFTTYETLKRTVLWVLKKDGRREPFDRDKAKRGILRAIEKRNVDIKTVEDLLDRLERELLKKKSEEIQSRTIGNAILRRLKNIDTVAWLRFASVYLEFESLEDFTNAINELKDKN